VAGPTGRLRALAPAVEIDGPRVRLGLAWAAVTTAAAAISPVVLVGWLALVAALAAAQTCRTWRRHRARPMRAVTVGGAAALALAGLGGPAAFGVMACALAIVAVVGLERDRSRTVTTLAPALAIGAATAAPVVVAVRWGAAVAVVLLLSTFVYDASAYIVGSGTVHRWEGVAAGIASVASLTLALAAGVVPPFRDASPWVLGVVAAVLLPLGPLAATALLGPRRAATPALRRIDSLLLAGPAWAATAALVL
jgi:hypothetical protein